MTRRIVTRSRGWLLGALLALLLAACGGTTPPTGTTGTVAAPVAATVAPTTASTAATTGATKTAAAGGATPGTATRAATTSAGATATRGGSPVAATASARAVATPRATSYPLTVTDDAGRAVTVARRPQRIVSLAPSNTELLFALGLADRVVGVDKYSNYPPEAARKPQISDYSSTNLEQVLATEPDLILAAGITSRDVIAAFESRGLTVVVLNPPTLDGVFGNISLLGQVADTNDAAARVRGDLESRLAALAARLATANTRPRVFFELDATQFFTVGPKSFIDDLIARAGGANIAADAATAYPKLSAEQIIAKDPEIIILSDEGYGATVASVGTRPGWAGISAVKNGRVVTIDPDLTNRPGPRVLDALERLARSIHPELFR
jgi:iron complex transport system substrate-binding protein